MTKRVYIVRWPTCLDVTVEKEFSDYQEALDLAAELKAEGLFIDMETVEIE